MPKTTKPMSKRSTKPKSTATAPRILDEETSAIVIAEYLAIEKVETKEIALILDGPRPDGLSYREIAVTFRVSEVLDVPVPFQIAPRYRLAFQRAQALVAAMQATTGSLVSTEAHQ